MCLLIDTCRCFATLLESHQENKYSLPASKLSTRVSKYSIHHAASSILYICITSYGKWEWASERLSLYNRLIDHFVHWIFYSGYHVWLLSQFGSKWWTDTMNEPHSIEDQLESNYDGPLMGETRSEKAQLNWFWFVSIIITHQSGHIQFF